MIYNHYHFEVLNALLRDNNVLVNGKGAEIGVRYGDTSLFLLRNNPNLKLYLVDPYAPYQDVYQYFTQEEQDKIFEHAKNKLSGFNNIVWIKKPSIDAAKEFNERELDFVFIDACHTYENAMADMHAWYTLIRKGGLLTGHDYSMPGVHRAVTEWAKVFGKEIFNSPPDTDVWAIELA